MSTKTCIISIFFTPFINICMHSFKYKCIQFFPPLFCSLGGLHTLVRDLCVEDRRFISSWLNVKAAHGKLQVYLVLFFWAFFWANNRRIETILGKVERDLSEIFLYYVKNRRSKNETNCKTSLVKMSFICRRDIIEMYASHLALFWNRGWEQLASYCSAALIKMMTL